MQVSLVKTDLERDIRLLHLAASRAEKPFREKHYRINIMLGLDFAKRVGASEAHCKVDKLMTYLSRYNRLNTHISYFGYYDIQPLRNGNGLGNVLHFHLFLDLDDKRWKGKVEKHVSELWREFGGNDVRIYDDEQGGIVYGRIGHDGDVDGVACPRRHSQCKKGLCKYVTNIGDSIVYSEEWLNRHTQD